MPLYKLSNKAKQDLINIAKYGDKHFRIKKSNHYRDQLKKKDSSPFQKSPIYIQL